MIETKTVKMIKAPEPRSLLTRVAPRRRSLGISTAPEHFTRNPDEVGSVEQNKPETRGEYGQGQADHSRASMRVYRKLLKRNQIIEMGGQSCDAELGRSVRERCPRGCYDRPTRSEAEE